MSVFYPVSKFQYQVTHCQDCQDANPHCKFWTKFFKICCKKRKKREKERKNRDKTNIGIFILAILAIMKKSSILITIL